jgi:hypothetical protein
MRRLTRNQEFGLVVLGLAAIGLSGSMLVGRESSQVAPPEVAQTPEAKDAEPDTPTLSPEVAALVRLVDEYAAGGAVPLAFTYELSTDYFKGAARKAYVPYTITLDRASLQADSVLIYVRVSAPAPAVPEAAAVPVPLAAGQPIAPPPSSHAFEDVHVVDLGMFAPGEPVRISRALAVASGDYDLYVAVRERGSPEGGRTSVARRGLRVPELFSGRLATSSVIQIERMGLHSAPLPAAERLVRPYAMGTMEVVPAWRSTYASTDTLSLFFVVYNPATSLETGKPNVTVDYDFYQVAGGEETFFNRTPRLAFDVDTLPAEFDLALGHQLIAERSVPLEKLPAGDYRVDILVNDRVSGQTVQHEVPFTVQAP